MEIGMIKTTEVFKALSDETRLRILHLLIAAGTELCCCEVTESLEEPQYNISRQMKILRSAGLVNARKESRWVYFSAATSKTGAFQKLLFDAIASLPQIEEHLLLDEKNLRRRLKLRSGGKCVVGIQKAYLLSGVKR